MTRLARTAFAIAATVAVAAPLTVAFAYSVDPMVYSLVPGGSGANIRLTIVNTHDSVVNVELLPFAVTADDTGKRTFTPAPDDFLIFPPQASIPSDRTQLFQIRYIGPARLDKGQVYVVRVHQTNTIEAVRPDPNANAQTRLNLSLNFNTTAIVQPPTMLADLAVERDVTVDANGVLRARLINRGSGVADLTRIGWAIDRDGTVENLATQDVKFGDAIFLEPGHGRDVVLLSKAKTPGRLMLKQPGARNGAAKS